MMNMPINPIYAKHLNRPSHPQIYEAVKTLILLRTIGRESTMKDGINVINNIPYSILAEIHKTIIIMVSTST